MSGERIAEPRFKKAVAYGLLQQHQRGIAGMHLRDMFTADSNRGQDMQIVTPYMRFGYAFQRVTGQTLGLLERLGHERAIEWKIDQMLRDNVLNPTERRAVLHAALRDSSAGPLLVGGEDVRPQISGVLKHVEQFSAEVLNGTRRGVTGKPIRNILAIGIGGSKLGPECLAEALRPYIARNTDGKKMNLAFVSNVDGADIAEKMEMFDPEETLVVVISKTFTTAETMQNARTAKAWFLDKLSGSPAADVIKKHFVAVSTNEQKVREFGIDTENMFGFWDWVGGRFSSTSAVGILALSLYLGYENAEQLLRGAEWMDKHFRTAPWRQNIPMMQGLLDVWNINFMHYVMRALIVYSKGLGKLPDHTKQVEMESNGKRVDLEGREVEFATGEGIMGGVATDDQHSWFQWLHQGTTIVPVDFIGIIEPQFPLPKAPGNPLTHQDEFMTNYFAQARALAFGKTKEQVRAELQGKGLDPAAIDSLTPFKVFPGNRPSSVTLIQRLDPFTMGALLAGTEHRTAVKGWMWGIGSFDQWGVELGKELGLQFRAEFQKAGAAPGHRISVAQGYDSATVAMVNAYLAGNVQAEG